MSMQLSPSSASFNTENRSKQIPNQIAQIHTSNDTYPQ